MEPRPEIFDESGPLHLQTSFNWRNPFDRRSLAASLVQGVYSLERDRQRATKEDKPDAHASPWYERFHFKLNQVLVDDDGVSYFGAIYEFTYPDPFFYQLDTYPPKYVIAFRGTLITPSTVCEDMKLNLRCAFNKLEVSNRFHTAFNAVRNTVATVGPANVWLAGHSLGASIAMLAGRNMAKSRLHLETYLFNPPFLSVRIAKSLVKAGIETMMNSYREVSEEDLFSVLSEWTPNMFVNGSDPICAEYIEYFQHREEKEEIGVGRLCSAGRMVAGVIKRYLEPLHIVPKTYMTENRSPSNGFGQAHGIVQWWQPHFQWQSKLYKFKTLHEG